MWIPLHKCPSFAAYRKINKAEKEDMLLSNYFLQSPKTEKLHGVNKVVNGLEIGHSSIQGYRPNMEDAFIIQCMDGLHDHVLVAVLDGHAGKGASEYFSSHISKAILNTRQYKKYMHMDCENRSQKHGIDTLSAALVQAFVDADENYYNYENKDNSGSTLICAVITPTHIVCASVGDSRCVVGTSDGRAISMSEDHKPSLEDEKRRITSAGGFVFLDRVNGELAMSRALGDYQYKRNENLTPAEQMVSCYPDVAVHKRTETDHIMVLACDGVWDVMSNCEAITYLQDIVLKEDVNASSESMADALVQISLAAGSTDNISAVVVKLRDEPNDDDRSRHNSRKNKVSDSLKVEDISNDGNGGTDSDDVSGDSERGDDEEKAAKEVKEDGDEKADPSLAGRKRKHE